MWGEDLGLSEIGSDEGGERYKGGSDGLDSLVLDEVGWGGGEDKGVEDEVLRMIFENRLWY